MNCVRYLCSVLLVVVISLFVGVPRLYAACVFGDATYCTKDSDCGPTEQCGAGRCCQAKNTTCGNAATPACNGWCAAGTSCTFQNGDCSCIVDTGGGGGGCSTSSPDPVNLVTPVDGAVFSAGTASVTLLWDPLTISQWGTNSCGFDRQYRVLIKRNSGAFARVATITDGADADSLPDANSYTYTLPVTTTGTVYSWYIVSNNGNDSNTSATWSFSLSQGAGGNVYVIPTANACGDFTGGTNFGDSSLSATWTGTTTTTRVNTSTGQTISTTTGTQSVSDAIDGSGAFLVQPSRGTQCRNVGAQIQECTTYASTGTLAVATIPADYVCASACGACPRTGVNSNSFGNNFFYTQVLSRGAWWQAVGSSVYAGSPVGESIKSSLPMAASRLIIPSGTSNVGSLIRASSTPPNLGTNGGELSDEKWSAVSQYRGKRMDYAYFASQLGLTASKASDWGSSDDLTKPAYDPNKEYYYMKPPSGTAVITTPWTLSAPEKYIILVDGDLRISADVTIPVGQFAAFIVKGKIIIDGDAGVTDIAGLLVTNQLFQTVHTSSGDDSQLVVQGSVVAWGGVDLNRDLGSANVTTPAEQFVYRPDLLVSMPDQMKSFALNWHEVAPGTFGN